MHSSTGIADEGDKAKTSDAVQIVVHGGYPELRVEGKPLFVHGATFDYFRIPRDLWESSLERYRELGINTIDIAIPWNWHEPNEGQFDFEGKTNPRRDLRGLLRLIAEKRFHLIARPAPIIRSHWRHGGYPGWLLDRAGIQMDAAERDAGALPPPAEVEAHDADLAARFWMGDAAHMAAVRVWLAALSKELAPYSPSRKVRVLEASDKPEDRREIEVSGPLLFVQLEESPGLAGHTECSRFWEYLETMRAALKAGGVDALYLVNSISFDSTAPSCRPPQDAPFFFTGRWRAGSPQGQATGGAPAYSHRLGLDDVASAALLAQSLDTQSSFPALVSDFQPGFPTPADDTRLPRIAQSATLLASRLLFARGVQGIEYAPLQDTLTPKGYETLDANRYFGWDAALNLSGRRQPQAQGVERNGELVSTWGMFLAASHTRAEFGLVDLRSAARESNELRQVTETLFRIQHMAALAGATGDLVDPDAQPLDVLLRYPAIVFPIPDTPSGSLELPVEAQQKLVEYVRAGGTLVYSPKRPTGTAFEPLWQSAPVNANPVSGPLLPSWKFGEGQVIAWGKDFNSWASAEKEAPESAAGKPEAEDVESFERVLSQANARPSVKRGGSTLIVTERISNAGTGKLGLRPMLCAHAEIIRDAFGPLCNRALLSVTNLDDEASVQEHLEVLSPSYGAHGTDDEYVPIDLLVSAHESLLLPLRAPLCGDEGKENCADEVAIAGAELLKAERDGKTLLLTFYAPARSTIALRLESQPAKISIGDINLEGKWNPDVHLLEFTLPRGAAPGYEREVAVHLRYTPHVPERSDPDKRPKQGFDATIADAISLPLGGDASLSTWPPLLTLSPDRKGSLLYRAENLDAVARDVTVKIDGDVHGSARLGLDPHELIQEKINLNAPGTASAATDPTPTPPGVSGLYAAGLQARTAHFEKDTPLNFISIGPDTPVAYAYDFERDGSKEWVLENSRLRLIISATDGGRATALVDKATGASLLTPIGGLRDLFSVWASPAEPAKEYDLTFNRPYGIEKTEEQKRPRLQLRYRVAELGVEIGKTVTIEGVDTVAAEYEFRLAGTATTGISPVIMNSVAAQGGGERSTRFCWSKKAAAETPAAEARPAEEPVCETFLPGGKTMEFPVDARRLEVRTPGQPTLVLTWEGAQVRIEPKMYSAMIKLELPALAPGAAPSRQEVRYSLVPVESLP